MVCWKFISLTHFSKSKLITEYHGHFYIPSCSEKFSAPPLAQNWEPFHTFQKYVHMYRKILIASVHSQTYCALLTMLTPLSGAGPQPYHARCCYCGLHGKCFHFLTPCPVGFEIKVFFLLYWLLTKAREQSLPCYQSQAGRNGDGFIDF